MRKIDAYQVNIVDRTKKFAVAIIRLSSLLPKTPAGFAIASQLVRAVTSIGANLVEAQEAVSRGDFIHKVSISLKESKETVYWLELVLGADLLPKEKVEPMLREGGEISRILVATVRELIGK